jgi:threonyl-tRNA synthetase
MVSQLTKSPLQVANPENLERIRHTCAHVMAMAVQILFPETKVTIGPTTDTGFYYDFARQQAFTPEDLTKITKQMRLIIKANLPIIREEVNRKEIKAEIEQLGEPYKLEILERLGKQIRNAELEKIPVVAVVGKREVEQQNLSLRTRKRGDLGAMSVVELKKSLDNAIANKANI